MKPGGLNLIPVIAERTYGSTEVARRSEIPDDADAVDAPGLGAVLGVVVVTVVVVALLPFYEGGA